MSGVLVFNVTEPPEVLSKVAGPTGFCFCIFVFFFVFYNSSI